MRKIGGHVSSAGGPVNSIKNTQNIGGNCIQIFAGSPRSWARSLYPQSQVDSFNQQVDALDLRPVFIHALYLVNLGSDNQDSLKKSSDSLLFDLRNGDSIHCAGLVVHLGSHQGRGFDSIKDQLVSQISALINQTQKTPFLIENSAYQQGKIGTLPEIEVLLKEINNPRLKVCLDTAHLFEAGYDLNQRSETDRLIAELETRNILPHVVCIHLNNSKTDHNSHHDQHADLDNGKISLEGLKYFITHPKINHLPLILETPGENKEGPNAHNISLAQQLSS